MRPITHVLVFVISLFLVIPAAWGSAEQEAAGNRERMATELLDRLDEGAFETAREPFDDTMQAALTAGQLEQVWTSLPTQLGAFRGRGTPRHQRAGDYDLVIIPMTWGDTTLDAHVAFDAGQRIAGFRMVPAAAEPAAE